ncbi:Glycoside hydrolase, superfamily [Penicillium expansum]|nr:Glycoside hydrolase, superfamily [Penicillium expansum]KGO40397.1 Glycoside hydrolase, superfamily [Penicillium expansum]
MFWFTVIPLLAQLAIALGQSSNIGLDTNKWIRSRHDAQTWIERMNVTEKVAIVTGSLTGTCMAYVAPVESIEFGGLCIHDGPAAIRLASLASVFPSGLTMAATWDKEMIYQRGSAMGAEFRGKGAHVMLGPVGGPLGRSALGGRNWEGFSPDPYLTGVAMDHTIRGVQSQGVQANAKHIIGNEQETQRKATEIDGQMVAAVSSNIDDRTMHELYLWPFADAVHAGVASVTCSYNRVNGTYSCQNKQVLNDLLKKELGFEGWVMSDYMGAMSGVDSAAAGMDMNQPGPISGTQLNETYWGPSLVTAVQNGSVPETRLNDMVQRILTPYLYFGQNHGSYPSIDPSSELLTLENFGVLTGMHLLSPSTATPAGRDVRGNHSALIRTMGSAGTVLLKNVNHTLPLKSPRNIGVFGEDAADITTGALNPNAGYNVGTLIVGGGSGGGRTSSIVPPLEAIKTRARKIGAQVQYITNTTVLTSGEQTTLYPWPEICLVFLKTWETEGVDRTDLEADGNSTQLVEAVANLCPKRTVVITHSGCPNVMPWASNPNVVAILAAHYPGEESGNSIADVLWGDVNPSGRLPYTVAKNATDYNGPIVNVTGPDATEEWAWQSNFTEGLFIDYRHFDSQEITPLYEFGYGLSYTTFSLASPISVTLTPSASHGSISTTPPAADNSTLALGGNPNLWTTLVNASTHVKNTGSRRGASVVQLYLSFPRGGVPSGTPIRVLRGFEKVPLNAGESKKVSFSLTRRDLSYWDVQAQDWRIPSGEIQISVGFSSRDLPLNSTVTLI